MTLSAAERDARHAFLTKAPYCAFCFHPSTTINYMPDHRSIPCCGPCFGLLAKVPQSWTFDQRLHYLQTMTIFNKRAALISIHEREERDFHFCTLKH